MKKAKLVIELKINSNSSRQSAQSPQSVMARTYNQLLGTTISERMVVSNLRQILANPDISFGE